MQHILHELDQIRTRLDNLIAAVMDEAHQTEARGPHPDREMSAPMPKDFRKGGDPQGALTAEANAWIVARMREGWSDRRLHRVTGVSLESIKKRRLLAVE
jgi:hypothetical protein